MPRNFDRSALDPNQIAVHGFGSGFRGYDQDEVRAYLQRLAAVMQDLLDEHADLARRLAEAEERAARPPELDEDQLTAALGAETARVLSSARQAAADIRVNADSTAAHTLEEATKEAAILRAGADQYADGVRASADEQQARLLEEGERSRAEAEAGANATRAAADTYAQGVRSQVDIEAKAIREGADTYAQGVRTDADAKAAAVKAEAETDAVRVRAGAEQIMAVRTAEAEEEVARIRAAVSDVEAEAERNAEVTREAARDEGRQMIAEAQQVRERMLKDLARRRKGARQQLEQLGAARERLLEAYAVVRQTVEDATSELLVALPEARFAAERAGRRARGEAEATIEELEAEIDAARVTDLAGDDANDTAAPETDGDLEPALEEGGGHPPVRIFGAQVAGAAQDGAPDGTEDGATLEADPGAEPGAGH